MSKTPIDAVQIRDHSIDPTKAEMWISVVSHWESLAAVVRGKMTGPHNHFASTVEVAYPLRPMPNPPAELSGLTASVIIPDPSLWEPERPFLYQGFIELWDDEKLQNSVQVQHGLRIAHLGPRGLRLNNRLLTIHGSVREPATEHEMLQLRQNGCNLLVAPYSYNAEPLWAMADRLGFLMLGRIESTMLDHWVRLRGHPTVMGKYASCFGWLLAESLLARAPDWWNQTVAGLKKGFPHFWGIELTRVPQQALPRQIDFIVCAATLLPALAAIHRSKLVIVDSWPDETALPPGILGWIQT